MTQVPLEIVNLASSIAEKRLSRVSACVCVVLSDSVLIRQIYWYRHRITMQLIIYASLLMNINFVVNLYEFSVVVANTVLFFTGTKLLIIVVVLVGISSCHRTM